MREVVRFLMHQIAEEQRLRREAIQQKVDRSPVKAPTDMEVESRIEEVQQILKRGELKV